MRRRLALEAWLDEAVAFVKTLPVKAPRRQTKEARRTGQSVNVTRPRPLAWPPMSVLFSSTDHPFLPFCRLFQLR